MTTPGRPAEFEASCIFNAIVARDENGEIYDSTAPFATNGTTEVRYFNGQGHSGYSRAYCYLAGGGAPTGITVVLQQLSRTNDPNSWVDIVTLDDRQATVAAGGYTTAGLFPGGVYRAIVSGTPGPVFIGLEGG